jgi:pimeloyl-ACP methyl ester carboxylesterase
MNNNNEVTPKHRAAGCLTLLGRVATGLLIIMLGLALVGSIYETRAETADALAYPPPGQMVDVGGYRLHINCIGTGSPTVVIDAGLGDWSTMWGYVQNDVAKTTRICTYDRAGLGWSEAGPLPRDAMQFAKELHTLLQNAAITGPYVLVGHSMGGLTVRVFAHEYPSEVAGIVLIDSMSPAAFTVFPADAASRPASPEHVFSVTAGLARFGLARLLVTPNPNEPIDQLEQSYYALLVRPSSFQATDDESQGMPRSGVQAGAVESFGNIPLIVLSRGLDLEADWQQWQAELLQLSSNSQQLIADKSGHIIHVDQPEAAVAAIVQMVEQVR